jgi:hypothetical protein
VAATTVEELGDGDGVVTVTGRDDLDGDGDGFGEVEAFGVEDGFGVDVVFGLEGGLLDVVDPFTAPELLLIINLDSSTASNARAGTCLS